MVGAKLNDATTFLGLCRTGSTLLVNTFYKANMCSAVTFCKLKMKFGLKYKILHFWNRNYKSYKMKDARRADMK